MVDQSVEWMAHSLESTMVAKLAWMVVVSAAKKAESLVLMWAETLT